MASFVLSLHSSQSDYTSAMNLIHFANAACDAGHSIEAIFLYQDAVWHSSPHIVTPSDEYPIHQQWQKLADRGLNLLLCVTAAEKRGINLNSTAPFTVAGLAEFAMTTAKADKWIQFK
ncbi:sulfurtransferase complex subunit TusD [Pseudoalteromonas ulvae]|uniref:Sulfurtransferase TusD n=1 Tax=Pseudoalteromonas ulvae TaxID=107327 RepID=A0A244CM30_PSEDV|nr:sulfurtransferase complex subunit TusD [Pseudoalteromonas ulvae]OUL56677.1 sulfurtransferase TusD [Pseudoalteromonas ulvae]